MLSIVVSEGPCIQHFTYSQQRVFTLQLFELHRLIKVQKLLAASPHLLLGDDRDSDSSTPELPVKNLPAESNIEFQPPMIEQKDDTLEQNQNIKCPTEKRGVHPTPDDDDDDDDANRKLDQLPNNEPCSGKSPAVSVVPDDRPSPWCFQPPSNQWLVPVMSPTEGLIYKPCTGFCPPSAGFVAPIYGFQGPLQLPVVGDFMNQANGVPVSNQQQNMGTLFRSPRVHLNYLPVPYGLPVVNPIIPASVVEQASSMTMPVGQTEQLSWISCDMLNASKDCRLQGSTASSPSERVQGEGRDAPAFHLVGPPTEGSSQLSQSNERDHGTHVIKVVPHTANSATQSAARIFQSIQEERGLLG